MNQTLSIDLLLQECFSSFALIDDSVKDFYRSNMQSRVDENDFKDGASKNEEGDRQNSRNNEGSKAENQSKLCSDALRNKQCKRIHDRHKEFPLNQSFCVNSKLIKHNKGNINDNVTSLRVENNQKQGNDLTMKTKPLTRTKLNALVESKENQRHNNNSRNKADCCESQRSSEKSISKLKAALNKSEYQRQSIHSPYHSKDFSSKDKHKDVSSFVNLYWKEQRLLKEKNEKIAKLRNEYEKLKEIEINKHCTFAPVLSKPTEASTNRNKVSTGSDLLSKREARQFGMKPKPNQQEKEFTYYPAVNHSIKKDDGRSIMFQVPYINDYVNSMRRYRESRSKDKENSLNNSNEFNVSQRIFTSSKECFRKKLKRKKDVAYYRSQSLMSIHDSRSFLQIEDFFTQK